MISFTAKFQSIFWQITRIRTEPSLFHNITKSEFIKPIKGKDRLDMLVDLRMQYCRFFITFVIIILEKLSKSSLQNGQSRRILKNEFALLLNNYTPYSL